MSASSGTARETVNAKVAALSLNALTHTALQELLNHREIVARSLAVVDHQTINLLSANDSPKVLGEAPVSVE